MASEKYNTFHFPKGLVPTRVVHLGALGNFALGWANRGLGPLIEKYLLLYGEGLSSCTFNSKLSDSELYHMTISSCEGGLKKLLPALRLS